jgi:hypothetical protein
MCTLVHAPYRWDSDEDGGDDDDDDSASEDGGHPGASGGTYCFARVSLLGLCGCSIFVSLWVGRVSWRVGSGVDCCS